MTESPADVTPQRLHPLTLLLRGIGIIPGLVLLGLQFVHDLEDAPPFFLGLAYLAVGYAVIALPIMVAHFVRFRYAITRDEIVIRSGVISRQTRNIPIERVQNVEIRQALLARAFGLARVQVVTAGSSGAEGVLEYVRLDEAHSIRAIVRKHQRREAHADVADDGQPEILAKAEPETPASSLLLIRMPLHRVLLSGVYRFSLLYILIIFSGIQYLNVDADQIAAWFTRGPLAPAARAVEASPLVALLVAALVACLLSWLIGILANLNRYFGFELRLDGDKLFRRHGLLTVHEGTIPIRRVQAAVFRSNLLMRAPRWRRLEVQSMGLDADQHGNQVVVPFARLAEMLQVTPGILPFVMPETFESVSRLHIRRLSIRYTVLLVAAALIGWWLVSPDALWLLAGWPLVPAFAYLQYRNHGYAFDGRHVFVRSGVLVHRLWVLPVEKLQALFSGSTYFQRRLGLSSVLVDTAGATTVHVPEIRDLAANTAARLLEDLHQAAQRTAGVGTPEPLPFTIGHQT